MQSSSHNRCFLNTVGAPSCPYGLIKGLATLSINIGEVITSPLPPGSVLQNHHWPLYRLHASVS